MIVHTQETEDCDFPFNYDLYVLHDLFPVSCLITLFTQNIHQVKCHVCVCTEQQIRNEYIY